MFKTLEELISVIRQRKTSSSEKSYTSKLLIDKKLKNVFHIQNKKSVKIHNYRFYNWIYTIANNNSLPPIKINT